MNDGHAHPDGRRGWFITFEGGEGVGKSTQIKLLDEALQKLGYPTLVTREPGGTPGGEAIRHVLLSGAVEPFGAEMEALLFSAARSDHVETVIRPALEKGVTVLCDRFYDSTRVYQGATGGVDPGILRSLERIACDGCTPDITLILDLDAAEGMRRVRERREIDTLPDRFERDDLELYELRRQAFLEIGRAEPERCIVIDASGPPKSVHRRVLKAVKQQMARVQPGWLNEYEPQRVES